jgi:RHS repeat-associated protein
MESTKAILCCRYSYDPLDRLTSQLQPDAPAHQRFYCKSRLATEIQGAIGYSVFQKDDLLLAQRKNQGGAVESTLLATDLQRSVLHTLTADQQQHPIAYSPYGHRRTESGLTNLLGFNGEHPDPVTGGYLLGNGYRMFNPVLMRFNSPDNLSPFGKGSLNCYMYCGGDPVNRTDPTGHWWLELLKSKTRGLTADLKFTINNAFNSTRVKVEQGGDINSQARMLGVTKEQLMTDEVLERYSSRVNSKARLIVAVSTANDSQDKNFTLHNAKLKLVEADQIVSHLLERAPDNPTTQIYKKRLDAGSQALKLIPSDLTTKILPENNRIRTPIPAPIR